jgi:hypothetical protein
MKCHYRYDDEEWVKGYIYTIGGDRVTLSSHCASKVLKEIVFAPHAEIRFNNGDAFTVSGYINTNVGDNNTYRLVCIDVSPTWRVPK